MNYKEKLQKIIDQNDGIVTSKDIKSFGIPRQYLIIFKNEKKLERVSRGIYMSGDVFEDKMYCIQIRFPKAIFSHETALYLHDLSDRDPLAYTVTVPQGYNSSNIKNFGIDVFTVKKDLYDLGIVKSKTIHQREIYTYDKERTICDILKARNKIDRYIFTDAMKRYMNSKSKDLNTLIDYSKKFRVEKILDKYLEAFL